MAEPHAQFVWTGSARGPVTVRLFFSTGAAEIRADQVDELSAIAGRVSTDDDLAAALTAFAAAIGFDLVSIIEATDPDTQARSVTVGFHPRPEGEPA
ncbi:MAG TPA: hypothetical protein VLR93_01435 [Patescibacteria group bacterium]|nr:hypothetical protein [Patescibacteria group bacterium]